MPDVTLSAGRDVKHREGNQEEDVPDASGLEGDGRRPSHGRRAVNKTAERNARKDYRQRSTVAAVPISPKSAAFSSPSSADYQGGDFHYPQRRYRPRARISEEHRSIDGWGGAHRSRGCSGRQSED